MMLVATTNTDDVDDADKIFTLYANTKMQNSKQLNNNSDDDDDDNYNDKNRSSNISRHVMFDPLTNFKDLNEEKMDGHLSQEQYKNLTPWGALTQVIAIPVVMLSFIVVMKINIFIKIFLIFMIILHIIISTCLVSYLSKNCTTKTPAKLTLDDNNNRNKKYTFKK